MKGIPFLSDFNGSMLKKHRLIQLVSLVPLLISLVCMVSFHFSLLSLIIFFHLLIVGVLMPQVYRDLIRSHLSLKQFIEQSKEPPDGNIPEDLS